MTDEERREFLVQFGNRVKKYRTQKGMTLEELANRMGYTSDNARSSAQKIEAGKNDLPASKIRMLAQVLEVPVGVLMGWDENWDAMHNPNGKLATEAELLDQIEEMYGSMTCALVPKFSKLDSIDQTKVLERTETLLEDEKYSAKEESSSGKAI